jgi:hypothetical protein
VLRRQLIDDAGISRRTVASRLRSGEWTEHLPGVIDLGTHPPTWRGQVLALALAAGSDAWASHDTAAHLLGFLDAPRPLVADVLVPRGRHARVAGHRLHTTRSIGADEVTVSHGIACTGAARTLLDLAVGTRPEVLERYLADRTRRDPEFVATLVELTDRHRTLPGRRRLLEVVARLPGDAGKLGSPLEVLGVQRLVQLGAPPFELQYPVRDPGGAVIKRVDVAWPSKWTLLELDGRGYHDLLGARTEDAEVRARMRALGWHVEVVRRHELDGASFAGFVRRLWTPGDGNAQR